MNGAQTWTVIGIFAATLFTLVGLVLRLVEVKVDGLRNEIVLRFEVLDRDLQRLYEHAFGREEGAPPA